MREKKKETKKGDVYVYEQTREKTEERGSGNRV